MMLPNADPAWDYYSIAETLLQMDNTRQELSKILSSEKAENGNLDTDEKILIAILKIEGDCRGIRKAIDSQFVEGSEPSIQMGLQNREDLNYQKASLECLRDIRSCLLRLSIRVTAIEAVTTRQ